MDKGQLTGGEKSSVTNLQTSAAAVAASSNSNKDDVVVITAVSAASKKEKSQQNVVVESDVSSNQTTTKTQATRGKEINDKKGEGKNLNLSEVRTTTIGKNRIAYSHVMHILINSINIFSSFLFASLLQILRNYWDLWQPTIAMAHEPVLVLYKKCDKINKPAQQLRHRLNVKMFVVKTNVPRRKRLLHRYEPIDQPGRMWRGIIFSMPLMNLARISKPLETLSIRNWNVVVQLWMFHSNLRIKCVNTTIRHITKFANMWDFQRVSFKGIKICPSYWNGLGEIKIHWFSCLMIHDDSKHAFKWA